MTARPRWSLSEPSFDLLLRTFDTDPERAALRYEEMRRKLARFFEWRGCASAEDHADEVFDRVARRLSEGLQVLNIGAYCYGIARLLLHEVSAHLDRQRAGAVELARVAARPVESDAEMTCLERCLDRFDPEARALILEYYEGERRDRQLHRREMADRLGIGANALRIRLHRIRRELEGCLQECLSAAETNGPPPPLLPGGRD